jgi:hypothetical protein
MRQRPDPEERNKRRDAAYERGWQDSLRGYAAHSLQPIDDVYYYAQGWSECAKYRWENPANNGCAPDPNYRKPRI